VASPSPFDKDDGLETVEDEPTGKNPPVAQEAPARRGGEVDQPSIVISDSAAPKPKGRRRGSAEKTLVIRDRRALDDVRKKIKLERERLERRRLIRKIGIWTVMSIAAVAAGGVAALLSQGSTEDAGAPPTQPNTELDAGASSAPKNVQAPGAEEADLVDLDQLPVEKPKAKTAKSLDDDIKIIE
jgi:hypothetical protein